MFSEKSSAYPPPSPIALLPDTLLHHLLYNRCSKISAESILKILAKNRFFSHWLPFLFVWFSFCFSRNNVKITSRLHLKSCTWPIKPWMIPALPTWLFSSKMVFISILKKVTEIHIQQLLEKEDLLEACYHISQDFMKGSMIRLWDSWHKKLKCWQQDSSAVLSFPLC